MLTGSPGYGMVARIGVCAADVIARATSWVSEVSGTDVFGSDDNLSGAGNTPWRLSLSCRHLHKIRYIVDEKETEFTLLILQVHTSCHAFSMPGSRMLLGYPKLLLQGMGQE